MSDDHIWIVQPSNDLQTKYYQVIEIQEQNCRYNCERTVVKESWCGDVCCQKELYGL
jgi:hypothetical protein